MWEDFSNALLDRLFSQELREVKVKDFMDLRQDRMSSKEYALKFDQFSRYAPEMVSNIRARMNKFALGMSHELVLKSKVTLFNKYIDISSLVMYMHQVDKGKKAD